jgi:hypothetical protein
MLCDKMLEAFELSELSLDAVRSIYRSTLKYSLNIIKSKDLKIIAKQHGVINQIICLKKNFLDSNYYMLSKFWRGVWWYSISNNAVESSDKYQVPIDDILLAKEFLTSEDFNELKKINQDSPENQFSEKDKLRLLNKIIPYINGIVRRKLGFIAKYDSALGTPDLIGELVAEAVRVIHHYDYLNEEKLLNYARRSVHNAAMNIVGARTTSSRQRIVRTDDGMGTLSHYMNTTYSLDKCYKVDEDDEYGEEMSEFIKDDKPTQLDTVEQLDMTNSIKVNLTDNEKKFINIVSGEYNEDFENWLLKNNEKITDSPFSRLVRNAYLFTDVSKIALKKKLNRSEYFKNRNGNTYGRHLRINQPA